MAQGVANQAGLGLLSSDDRSNASAFTEVADYSSVPPGTEPPIPIPAAKTVDNGYEHESSDDRRYKPSGGADFMMEAPIFAEDVIRAGGLGARDELGQVLPSAIDATDFEASLRDAQQYEDVEPESDLPRPGVGFVKDQEQKMNGYREV